VSWSLSTETTLLPDCDEVFVGERQASGFQAEFFSKWEHIESMDAASHITNATPAVNLYDLPRLAYFPTSGDWAGMPNDWRGLNTGWKKCADDTKGKGPADQPYEYCNCRGVYKVAYSYGFNPRNTETRSNPRYKKHNIEGPFECKGSNLGINAGGRQFCYCKEDPKPNFVARFKGNLRIPVSGDYQFSGESDGGVAIYVDGDAVQLREPDGNTTTNATGKVSMQAGHIAKLTVLYVHNNGPAKLHVKWAGPGFSLRHIEEADLPPMQKCYHRVALAPRMQGLGNPEKVLRACFSSEGQFERNCNCHGDRCVSLLQS
jgi:hypothetical protein